MTKGYSFHQAEISGLNVVSRRELLTRISFREFWKSRKHLKDTSETPHCRTQEPYRISVK